MYNVSMGCLLAHKYTDMRQTPRSLLRNAACSWGKMKIFRMMVDGNPVLPCHRKELQLNLFKEIVPATGQQLHPHFAVGEAASLSIGN